MEQMQDEIQFDGLEQRRDEISLDVLANLMDQDTLAVGSDGMSVQHACDGEDFEEPDAPMIAAPLYDNKVGSGGEKTTVSNAARAGSVGVDYDGVGSVDRRNDANNGPRRAHSNGSGDVGGGGGHDPAPARPLRTAPPQQQQQHAHPDGVAAPAYEVPSFLGANANKMKRLEAHAAAKGLSTPQRSTSASNGATSPPSLAGGDEIYQPSYAAVTNSSVDLKALAAARALNQAKAKERAVKAKRPSE